eukprot:gene17280-22815_t
MILDDSDEESVQDKGFRVNSKYAEKFEKLQLKQELQRNKHILNDYDELEESDSESESEDEDAQLLDTGLELKIVKTINMIRRKDPQIYDKNNRWFPAEFNDDVNDDIGGEDDENTSYDKNKRVVMKKLLHERILSGDNGDLEEDDPAARRKELQITNSKNLLLYDNEQEEIRQKFINAANSEDNNDELLTVKTKTVQEIAEEERLLSEELDQLKQNGNYEDPADNFLADYILKQKWKDESFNLHTEATSDLIEDEKQLEEAEVFESKYNFRFEELNESDDVQVIGHDRRAHDSVRRLDDKRKIARDHLRERKEKERRQKEEEMKRLKNLKKKELQERLRKISEVGGLHELGIDESALDEEWDPSKHDELMSRQFGSNYYTEQDDMFDAEVDQVNDWLLASGEEEELETDDYETSIELPSNKSKTDVNSSEHSKSILDELYQLDYEDIVAGIPCRFKYKSVEPESFGLTVEEILLAEDSELNRIVSLKKLSPYNNYRLKEDERKKIAKRRKRLHSLLKGRLENSSENEETGKKKRKRHKKISDSNNDSEVAIENIEHNKEDKDNDKAKERKLRRHKKSQSKIQLNPNEDRLKLYN